MRWPCIAITRSASRSESSAAFRASSAVSGFCPSELLTTAAKASNEAATICWASEIGGAETFSMGGAPEMDRLRKVPPRTR